MRRLISRLKRFQRTGARLARLSQLVEQHGLQALPRNSFDHLEDKLWELRIRGRAGIARAIYVTAPGQRAVIVRVFIKKTQKTPQSELELTRKRAREAT
jgi:phage-related protein